MLGSFDRFAPLQPTSDDFVHRPVAADHAPPVAVRQVPRPGQGGRVPRTIRVLQVQFCPRGCEQGPDIVENRDRSPRSSVATRRLSVRGELCRHPSGAEQERRASRCPAA